MNFKYIKSIVFTTLMVIPFLSNAGLIKIDTAYETQNPNSGSFLWSMVINETDLSTDLDEFKSFADIELDFILQFDLQYIDTNADIWSLNLSQLKAFGAEFSYELFDQALLVADGTNHKSKFRALNFGNMTNAWLSIGLDNGPDECAELAVCKSDPFVLYAVSEVSVTEVPEPNSLMLFSLLLAFCFPMLKRRQ